jgi:hypothetical protein
MTKEQVKEILDRVLTWSPERQAEAVRVLTEIAAQDASSVHLTDEQAAVGVDEGHHPGGDI